MALTPLDIAHELGAALRLNDDQFERYKGRRTGFEADGVVRPFILLSRAMLLSFKLSYTF